MYIHIRMYLHRPTAGYSMAICLSMILERTRLFCLIVDKCHSQAMVFFNALRSSRNDVHFLFASERLYVDSRFVKKQFTRHVPNNNASKLVEHVDRLRGVNFMFPPSERYIHTQ